MGSGCMIQKTQKINKKKIEKELPGSRFLCSNRTLRQSEIFILYATTIFFNFSNLNVLNLCKKRHSFHRRQEDLFLVLSTSYLGFITQGQVIKQDCLL